jgi:hypothetical protein
MRKSPRTVAPRTVDERGVALVIIMMTITLLTALGTALILATITETAIAANYRDAAEALYAAEGAVEFVMQELADVPDWSDVIAESGGSAFVDGSPDGIRMVGVVTLDLTHATRDVNAIAAAPGAVRPPWVLYAFGRFEDLVPSSMGRSRIYVAVWVADRSETPGDETSVPEALSIFGQAYGPQGSRRSVEAIVTKADTSAIRVRSWRELR